MNLANLSDEELLQLEKDIHQQFKKRVKTIKVVINDCFGGFTLSQVLEKAYEYITGKDLPDYDDLEDNRTNPILIYLVERLGEIDEKYVKERPRSLVVDTIDLWPGRTYHIHEYDGKERLEMIIGKVENISPLPENIDDLFERFLVEQGISPGKSKII